MIERLELVAIRVRVPLVFEGAGDSALLVVFLKNMPCPCDFASSYMDGCVTYYVQELCRCLVELVGEYFVMVCRFCEFVGVELFLNP